MRTYAFGVDVGATTVKIGLFQNDGNLIEKWGIPTVKQHGGSSVIDDISYAVLSKIKDKNLLSEEIAGIGVGVPGPVTDDGVVHGAVNIGWGNVPIAELLNKKTNLNIKVTNDANLAALGEMWKGAGEGNASLVFVTLGTGVGGGIVLNKQIISGSRGSAGEIGHIHVESEEEELCTCGNKGCLEQYASATGVVRMAERMKIDYPDSILLKDEIITAKSIFESVELKDELGCAVAEKFGYYLGIALADIANIVDPEVIIIGGGVSNAGDILIKYIEKYFVEYAFHEGKETKIVISTLKNDAGIYGGAKMVLD